MSVRILRSLWRNGKGSALIEGAIIVPVLLVLVLGVFEFSWLIYQQHLISTGIHDARALYCAIREPPRSNDSKRREKIWRPQARSTVTPRGSRAGRCAMCILATPLSIIRWVATD